jgi:hypothetical protein
MFTRAGRIAAAAFVVPAAFMAVARCGGIHLPTEPASVTATPTPIPGTTPASSTPTPAPSPAFTAGPPTPTPAPTNSAVFGYVSTVPGAMQHYLSGAVLTLHQDGAADQVAKSGSSDGYYAFCCLNTGSAVITATLPGYQTFRATITVGQSPVRFDIQLIAVSGGPPPTQIPVPIG